MRDAKKSTKITTIKIISITCIIILIANILLFSFRIYDALTMWIILAVIGIIAFPGMKLLKKKQ